MCLFTCRKDFASTGESIMNHESVHGSDKIRGRLNDDKHLNKKNTLRNEYEQMNTKHGEKKSYRYFL